MSACNIIIQPFLSSESKTRVLEKRPAAGRQAAAKKIENSISQFLIANGLLSLTFALNQ